MTFKKKIQIKEYPITSLLIGNWFKQMIVQLYSEILCRLKRDNK